MGRERVAIGYLLLGVLTVAALVGAVAGISWAPGPQPSGLRQAVAATRALSVYAVSTTVWTNPVPTSSATGNVPSLNSYLTVGQGAARLSVATTPVSGGQPERTTSSAAGDRLVVATSTGRVTHTSVTSMPDAIGRLTAGFDHYLAIAATASNVKWNGDTYTFSVPASEVAQPGLPAYTVAQSRAAMAVTVVGGVVGTITVSMAGYGSSQYQTIDITTPAAPGQY